MCFIFDKDRLAENIISKIATLFDMNVFVVENEILKLFYNIQVKFIVTEDSSLNFLSGTIYPNIRKYIIYLTTVYT